jgi:hypothetical protein
VPLDAGVALDFLDIRPEDIRVEPGVAYLTEPVAPEPSQTSSAPESAPAFALSEPDSPPLFVETAASAVAVPTPPEPVMPPIRVDAPPRRVPARAPVPSVRARDLVLPRFVVAAWSMLVLMAVVCAFLAGLLAGHYVWRVH